MEQQMNLDGGGVLLIRQAGSRVSFQARCPLRQEGLYKLWLRGQQGELLLGTMIPEGGALTLSRSMSADTLRQAGCWPVIGGRIAMAYLFPEKEQAPASSGWHWTCCPGRRLSDPVLAQAAGELGPMLLQESAEGFRLAAPLDVRRPFPLVPLFCLAQLRHIDGGLHVVFSFLTDGTPQKP